MSATEAHFTQFLDSAPCARGANGQVYPGLTLYKLWRSLVKRSDLKEV